VARVDVGELPRILMDFLKANAGKLGLAAVLLIAAAVLYSKFGGGHGPQRSSKVPFVCVETGKIFWLPREPRLPPVENPDSKKRTLVPCYEREDGKLAVSERMSSVLKDLSDQGLNKFVDLKTFEVTAKS
jgi:hypothetical protein